MSSIFDTEEVRALTILKVHIELQLFAVTVKTSAACNRCFKASLSSCDLRLQLQAVTPWTDKKMMKSLEKTVMTHDRLAVGANREDQGRWHGRRRESRGGMMFPACGREARQKVQPINVAESEDGAHPGGRGLARRFLAMCAGDTWGRARTPRPLAWRLPGRQSPHEQGLMPSPPGLVCSTGTVPSPGQTWFAFVYFFKKYKYLKIHNINKVCFMMNLII